MYDYVFIVDH